MQISILDLSDPILPAPGPPVLPSYSSYNTWTIHQHSRMTNKLKVSTPRSIRISVPNGPGRSQAGLQAIGRARPGRSRNDLGPNRPNLSGLRKPIRPDRRLQAGRLALGTDHFKGILTPPRLSTSTSSIFSTINLINYLATVSLVLLLMKRNCSCIFNDIY